MCRGVRGRRYRESGMIIKKKEHNARLDEEPDNNSRGGRRGGGRTAALTLVWTWFVLDCIFDCFV